ncbi:MAG: Rv3235 family protein [Trebonia sp.]
MSVEQSTIQLVPVPELWPPLARQPAPTPTTAAGPTRSAAIEQGPALPRQFAVLLAEVLAGVRPARQLAPWLSQRGSLHLRRLMPLFKSEQQPKVLRVLTTRPAPTVVEMTMILVTGPRPRALAIRLEYDLRQQRWQCTDLESA